MANSALELIEQKLKVPPFNGPENYDYTWIAERQTDLISWLMLKGVTSRAANMASRDSIRKAYGSRAYLEGWLRREGGQRRRNVNVELGGVEAPEPEVPDILKIYQQDPAPTPRPEPEVQLPLGATIDQFAAIVGQVVDQKLARVKSDLILELGAKGLTEQRVREIIAATKIELSEPAKDQIRALGREAAVAYIEEMLPKRIEIRAPNLQRELRAEPRHEVFDECLRWLASGESIYLVGPAGTGKTHLAKQLADALGKRFLPVPQALTKYEFSGFIDAGGSYRGTIVRDAIENGGLLVLDEIDSMAAAAIMFLNSVMANGYCAFPDGIVEKHPDFQVIAAANTYGRGATREYVGRNPLDAASLDRFVYIECEYDTLLERQLFGESPWLNYVHKVRAAITQLNIQHIASMRAIERGLRGLAAGLDAQAVVKSALWRGLAPDSISKIEAQAGRFHQAPELRVVGVGA